MPVKTSKVAIYHPTPDNGRRSPFFPPTGAAVSENAAITAACSARLDVWNDPVAVDAAPWMIYIPCVRTTPVALVLVQDVIPPKLVMAPSVDAFNRQNDTTRLLVVDGVISLAP
jgi:hypothetical protein